VISGKKIVVVMPAYNAARTLERTWREIPRDVVDEVVVVDDGSSDETVAVARRLGASLHVHDCNRGYGANQKTCYRIALELDADVVVMLHPDYQYPPAAVSVMGEIVAGGRADVVLGSRVAGGLARAGGMPLYKYVANRALTVFENRVLGMHLSEYHTGYRAFSRTVLETLPLSANSDDFLFDNQILAQAVFFGFRIAEISTPARYHAESSSVGLGRSLRYGAGVVATALSYRAAKLGWRSSRIFRRDGRPASADQRASWRSCESPTRT
jgi:glycosyltransferase involved in cell wall biosynthesis